jgi:hypothetical protein
MSNVLWSRLCTVEVPEQFAEVAARARSNLTTAWAALRPEDRTGVEEYLCRAPAENHKDLLRYLSTASRDLYNAAIGVRGLVVLVVEIGGAPAARSAAGGRGHAPPGAREKEWAGLPVVYQEREYSWYAAVFLDLVSGQHS